MFSMLQYLFLIVLDNDNDNNNNNNNNNTNLYLNCYIPSVIQNWYQWNEQYLQIISRL